jgi:membrane protease YdiL (CAAX protease family)
MESPSQRVPVIVSAVLVEGGLAVTAWLLGIWWGYPPGEAIQFTWPALGWGLAAVLPMLALALGVERSRWRPWRRLMKVVRRQIVPMFADCSYLDLALISALAGLGEEALFRGVLQPAVASWLGIVPALLLTSVLFGAAHMITPGYFVLATALGGYLGYLALATENLLAPIIAHAVYDFLALTHMVGQARSRRDVIRATDYQP